jgi:glutathione S-transferase
LRQRFIGSRIPPAAAGARRIPVERRLAAASRPATEPTTHGMEDSGMIKLYGVSVSNYYNKVKFSLLEKGIAFSEETMAPSEDEALLARSPMGKIPCIDVDGRPLSESQAIVEYLEAVRPEPRLIPADPYAAAKCRELVAFIELYLDLPARRLLGHAVFGAPITEEVKREVAQQLDHAVARFPRIARFGGHLCGEAFTLADIAAFVHLTLVSFLTTKVLGRDMLAPLVGLPAYLQRIGARPHAQHVTRDREAAMARIFARG